MNKAISLIAFLVLFTLNAKAQNGFSKLYRYSGDNVTRAEAIAEIAYDSSRNCLYFPLEAIAYPISIQSTTFYKTDMQGNVLKEVPDTFPSGYNAVYESVALSKDHRYVYWGGSIFISGHFSKWEIRKTDTNLNTIWVRDYDCNALAAYILKIKMLQEDESFVTLMAAYTNADNGWGYPEAPPRIYLKHIDSSGNVISEDTLGPGYYDNPNDMELTNDGGYVINGRTFSWGQSNGSGYVLKADTAGNEVWHQFYAQDAYSTWLEGMVKSKEAAESYYNVGTSIFGTNQAGKGFINKIDANGNELWHKYMAMDNTSHNLNSIAIAANSYDIAAAGNSYYYPNGESLPPRGWIVRLDKDGNEKWNRIYSALPAGNEDYDQYLYSIASLPDGGFVAAGSSFGQDANGHWTQDGWVIRVDSNGCISPQDCGLDVGVQNVALNTNSITLFPNPVKDEFKIVSDMPFPSHCRIFLTDIYGRTVKQLQSPAKGAQQITGNISGIPPGIYFVQLQFANITVQKKIVITP